MKDQSVREETKKLFEEELKKLQEKARLVGFRIDGRVTDPMEDAFAEESLLVDARKILEDTFRDNVTMADMLGYNVRVDRKINPLDTRNPQIEVVIWGKRNNVGGYDD
jgi:FKBP-type peptidyl-prolyl cis-trans isomerase (trigger factor)